MCFRHAFIFISLAVALSHCQMDESIDQNLKKVYCGKKLTQILSTVCKGNYNTLHKRAEHYNGNYFMVARYKRDVDDQEKDMVDFPFKSKPGATSLMGHYRRRKKRGVFNECCEKPCSQEELSPYCGERRRK